MAAATSRRTTCRCQFFRASTCLRAGTLLLESSIFSSTETTPSIPIGDIQHLLVAPGGLEFALQLLRGGKVRCVRTRRPSKLPSSAGAGSREASHAPECQSQLFSAAGQMTAAC